MTNLKRLLYFLIIFMVVTVEIFGSGQNRAGTAAAPELLIPVGSRYVATGGSFIATATGLEAIYFNPAGVDLQSSDANMMFSYRSYIADIHMSYFAVSAKFGFGSVAVSLRSLSFGNIPITTMNFPDGTGGTFNPTYFVLGLTYSKQLTDRISVGVNINLISESFDRVSASTAAMDFGVQYRNLFSVPGLAIGVTVKNLGFPMKYGGPGLWKQATDPKSARGLTFYEVGAQSYNLPSTMSIGLSYTKSLDDMNKIGIAGTFANNNYSYDNYSLGLEYSYNNLIFVRGGYLFSPQATSNVPNIFQNFAAGFGVNLKNVNGMDITFDYAYIPVKYFTANNAFTVKIGF